MWRRGGWLAVVLCGLAGLVLSGCTMAADPWKDETAAIKVVATIPPVAAMVKEVGADRVAVKCLCMDTGPHHYQADHTDALLFNRATVFFAVGLSLDDTFADKLHGMARRSDMRYVKIGNYIEPTLLLEMKHSHDHKHGKHDHKHGRFDPHIWLGIKEAISMVEVIRDELTKLDEKNKTLFEKNAADFIDKLKRKQTAGRAALAKAKGAGLISFHESLGYFARSFDLDIRAVIQQGPGDEPTAGTLKELVDLCLNKQNPIRAIAVEPQYSESSSAALIRKEVKAKGVDVPLIEIDPMETLKVPKNAKEKTPEKFLNAKKGEWYLERLDANLAALEKVLQ